MASEQLFYIGVKGLIQNSKGEYLVLLADVTNHRKVQEPYWDIPGGRIQKGQGLMETLQREIAEETGVKEIIGEPTHFATLISNHQVPFGKDELAGLALVIYKVVIDKDADIKISQEHASYEWVTHDEAAKRLSNKYPKSFTDLL